MFAASKSSNASRVLSVEYVGSASSTDNNTTYNFGSFSIPSNGVVVVGFTSRGDTSRSISGVTIGGTAATLVTTVSAAQLASVAYVYKDAGSHNVTVTLSGSRGTNPSNILTVWVVKNATSYTEYSSKQESGTTTARIIDFNTPASGVAIISFILAVELTVNWSSATEVLSTTLATRRHEHAAIYSTVSATPHNETINGWGSSVVNNAAAVCFQ